MSDHALVTIDHDEGRPDATYRGTVVRYKGRERRFASESPEFDVDCAVDWALRAGAPEVWFSSSVDNFCMDSLYWGQDVLGLYRLNAEESAARRVEQKKREDFDG